jgi:hypothetical protein
MKDFKTEEEAEKKWCPLYRGLDTEDEVRKSNCIASECMFWRWSHQDTGPTDPPTGFCGAAGLPRYI